MPELHFENPEQIDIVDRARQDYGDVEDLADSIRTYGLIQPIVINQDKRLIAGGRRLRAYFQLAMEEPDEARWKTIPCYYIETLSEDYLKELEIEENTRRKDFLWWERCIAVHKTHALKVKRGLPNGDHWGMRQTGEMLNMSLGIVSATCQLAERLLAEPDDGPFHKAIHFADAWRMIEEEKERSALAELARRTPVIITRPEQLSSAASTDTSAPVRATRDPLLYVHHAEAIHFMKNVLEPESVEHIVTDPPYAIDMDHLNQMGKIDTSSVEDAHRVEENIDLLTRFFPAAYNTLKDSGFLVFWCDIMWWDFLYRSAIATGFKVQRWPLVWRKTSICLNQMAQFNFTKNFEIAMVCRKGNATLVQPAASSVIDASNEEDRPHPFWKPYVVWSHILRHIALPGAIILDPFSGAGSCTVACLKLGLNPIAVEKEETHYNAQIETIRRLGL